MTNQLSSLIVLIQLCYVSVLCNIHNVSVSDNVPQGSVIADLRSLLLSRFHSSLLNTVSFAFLNNPNVSLFQLEPSSGLLTAASSLDRDQLCPQLSSCQQKLDIGLHRENFFEKINLYVNFADENDNSPQFPSDRVQVSVSESTRVGSELPIHTATDVDSQRHGIDRYEMISPVSDLPFDLRVSRNSDGSFELRLVLTQPLDREHVSLYHVQLAAIDRGQPPRTGTSLIEVVITDVNDNRPVFSHSNYTIKVNETQSKTGSSFSKTPLMAVHATDADLGDNGRVRYKFTKRTETNVGDKFSIDRNTGEIFLHQGLDFEQDRFVFYLDIIFLLILSRNIVISNIV